ncbi:MAG: N-acetylmuramidase family protein [Hyphomonadaceae bacterium]|nr:N-acetylmuramidase family protein [Hyphomonadaceae bacterium]
MIRHFAGALAACALILSAYGMSPAFAEPAAPPAAAPTPTTNAATDAYLASLLAQTRDAPTDADVAREAAVLGVEPAALRAVMEVEGGRTAFAEDGRPVILFEPHLFSRATQRRFDASNPAVSYPVWDRSKYPATQAARWAQLSEAYALDPDAALGAASYGRYQVLGRNFTMAGYADVRAFVSDLASSEAKQLTILGATIRGLGLLDELQRKDWAGFARGYNGPAGAARYGEQLTAAYARLSAPKAP